MLTKSYNPLHEQGSVKSKVLLAASLAKRFDLPKEEIDKLRIAVLLYDIGNIMLPKEILQDVYKRQAHIYPPDFIF